MAAGEEDPETLAQMAKAIMAVNARGIWLGLKYAMPHMRVQGGSIIITSSVAGVGGSPGMVAYSASKHAVIGLMRTAALEGAPNGIRVNTIHPGPTQTEMMRAIEERYAPGAAGTARADIAADIPLKRYAQPAEVASLALFLASDESSCCSGSMFMIDGGIGAGAVPGRQ